MWHKLEVEWCKALHLLTSTMKNDEFLQLYFAFMFIQASLVAQLVKNPPAMQQTPVRFLGWEDPLEKG